MFEPWRTVPFLLFDVGCDDAKTQVCGKAKMEISMIIALIIIASILNLSFISTYVPHHVFYIVFIFSLLNWYIEVPKSPKATPYLPPTPSLRLLQTKTIDLPPLSLIPKNPTWTLVFHHTLDMLRRFKLPIDQILLGILLLYP